MVIKAFQHISKIPTKLFVFSDDMDGLRKVPENIPNQKLIERKILRNLFRLFLIHLMKFESFAKFNNNKLIEFLDSFDFKFEFQVSN